MRAILDLDWNTSKWYAWMADSDNMQITARLGPFGNGLAAAKGLFQSVGEPIPSPWMEDEYVGG